MDGWMEGSIDGLGNGWMDRWMDGWMDGWMTAISSLFLIRQEANDIKLAKSVYYSILR